MPAGPCRRRALLAGALSAAASPAPAQAPRSKAEVAYQTTPKGIAMCASCTLFIRPDRCRVVEGVVAPDAWCSLYDMVD